MQDRIINNNTLLFSVSDSGDIDISAGLDGANCIITNFIADMRGVQCIHLDVSCTNTSHEDRQRIKMIKNNLTIFERSIFKKKGSFVVVCEHVFDEDLNIVPSIQEAIDFVEMEEIERELDV